MNWYIIHCTPSNYRDIAGWTVNRSTGTVCNLLTLTVFTRLSDAELTLLQLQWSNCDIDCHTHISDAVGAWNKILREEAEMPLE